jgi:hypothetical protein
MIQDAQNTSFASEVHVSRTNATHVESTTTLTGSIVLPANSIPSSAISGGLEGGQGTSGVQVRRTIVSLFGGGVIFPGSSTSSSSLLLSSQELSDTKVREP